MYYGIGIRAEDTEALCKLRKNLENPGEFYLENPGNLKLRKILEF